MKTSGLTEKQKAELKKISQKAPRAGVRNTKVVPDKTKYTRKKKHKGKNV